MARIEHLEEEIVKVTNELKERKEKGQALDMESLVKENSILLGNLSQSTELVEKLQTKAVKWKRRARRQPIKAELDMQVMAVRLKTMHNIEKLKRQAFKEVASGPQVEIDRLRTANADMTHELKKVKSELDTLRTSCHELSEKCQSYETVVQDSIARVQKLQQDNESLVAAFKRLMEENKAMLEMNEK